MENGEDRRVSYFFPSLQISNPREEGRLMSNKIMIEKFLLPVGIFVLAFGLSFATRPVNSFAGSAKGFIKGSRGYERFHKPNRKHRTKSVIYVGPTTDANVLDLLYSDFDLVYLDDSADPEELGHLLVGPEELNNAGYVVLLREAYAAGYTVGITESGPKDVQRLQQTLGFTEGCQQLQPDSSSTPFVGMQKGGNRHQTYRYTSIMLPRQDAANTKVTWRNILQADYRARQWLRLRFADSPIPPLTDSNSSCAQTDPTACLMSLASSTQCNWLQQNSTGDSISLQVNVWGTRSFTDALDYYYVEEEATYYIHDGADAIFWLNGAKNTLTEPNIVPATDQPSPDSTSCSTSITSGVSYSFGGNAGYNQTQGFNATPANVGMNITNSTTTNCPSTQITYQGDPVTGITQWTYGLEASSGTTLNNQAFVIDNHWIWEIDFNEYLLGQNSIQFTSGAFLTAQPILLSPQYSVNLDGAVNVVPFPFNAFTVEEPTVTSVNPTTVLVGGTNSGTFDILGGGLYPSLIQDVLIGGNPLQTGNYTPHTDTDISVTLPDTTASGEYVVEVVTTQESNTNIAVQVDNVGSQVTP
jgi:hypothetical protein